jgi:hypothetical protein
MRPEFVAITVAMMGYLGYLFISGDPGNLTTVEGHRVQDLPGKDEAAERIAKVKQNIQKIVSLYKQDEYVTDKPTQLLVERYRPDSILENSVTSKDTSYSENKGEKIVICLRDKNDPPAYPFVDMNTVMFVVLHEMAHLMTAELSSGKHTPEFWANFRRLLEDASRIGIYTPVNYAKSPVDYCGMKITDSPL